VGSPFVAWAVDEIRKIDEARTVSLKMISRTLFPSIILPSVAIGLRKLTAKESDVGKILIRRRVLAMMR
jgi:hypothetical protein